MDYQIGIMQKTYFRFKSKCYEDWNNAPQNVNQQ